MTTPATFDPARPRGYVHASARLAERYGIDLSPDDHLRLSRMVADADLRAVPVAHLRGGRLMVAYHLGGDWVPAVWSPTSGTIITFYRSERLDWYRAMLARIDPATGKAWEADPAAPEPSPVADRPFVGRIIERGDGVPIPHGWGTAKGKKDKAIKARPTQRGGLPDSAAALQAAWAAHPLDGPLPSTPDEAEAERAMNNQEIDALIAERATPPFNRLGRSIDADRLAWHSASAARIGHLNQRNRRLREISGNRSRKIGRKPAVWWADYADLGRRAGCGPTTDPAAILAAALVALRSFGERIEWQYTDQEDAVQHLIERWMDRDKKGPPPDYIDRPATDADETTETGASS